MGRWEQRSRQLAAKARLFASSRQVLQNYANRRQPRDQSNLAVVIEKNTMTVRDR
jgi:hypothetical protein